MKVQFDFDMLDTWTLVYIYLALTYVVGGFLVNRWWNVCWKDSADMRVLGLGKGFAGFVWSCSPVVVPVALVCYVVHFFFKILGLVITGHD